MNGPMPPEATGPPRVAIVGGGITGLAAAWELEPQSRAGALAVDVFEASPRLGGPIASDLGSGYVLEGGPDCFLTTKPGALELCEELGLSDSVIGVRPSARRAYIYREGRLHRIPAVIGPSWWGSARSLVSSRLLSRAGKLRMLLGGGLVRLRPIRADEGSALGPQLRSRFGDEAVDWLLEPFVAGVHPAPLDSLSAAAVASVLPSRWTAEGARPPDNGSPRATSRADGSGSGIRAPAGVFASLREGMEQLPRTLAARLRGATVHLARPVRELRWEGDRYALAFEDGGTVTADGVVLAVSPPVAGRLLAREFPAAAARLDAVRMESIVVVAAVYDRKEIPVPLDGSGVLVPRRSGLAVSAFTWLSAKWDRADPDSGRVALRVFLRGEPGRPDLPSSEESLALAREGLREVMGITAAPGYATVFPHRSALAWYEVGHLARIREVRKILGEGSGIELAGGAYDGIGIPDAIRSGRNAARRVGTCGKGRETIAVRDELPRPNAPTTVSERVPRVPVGNPS